MAKITITIEDSGPNKVKVVADPTFDSIMKLIVSGGNHTSAHGYALSAIRAIQAAAKSQEPQRLLIPRLSS